MPDPEPLSPGQAQRLYACPRFRRALPGDPDIQDLQASGPLELAPTPTPRAGTAPIATLV